MCESLMESNHELFTQYFIKDFCELANDKVVNVRMAVAEAIQKSFKKNQEFIKGNDKLKEVVSILKEDKCRDVKEIMNDVIVDTID